MNISDLGEVTPLPQNQPPSRAPNSEEPVLNLNDIGEVQSEDEFNQDKYGGLGQQAISGLEGAAQGALGPVATVAEVGLGIKPEDIRGREEANPITHGLAQTAGFVAPLLLTDGLSAEAKAALNAGEIGLDAAKGTSAVATLAKNATLPGLAGQFGEAVAKATGLGGEGASTISKIASSGIKTGAEMAALQAGDEVSKVITQDPNQSLGSAAINVGLSGIIGGAGGAIIGSVSPLWKSLTEKAGIPDIIDDAKAQYDFRQKNPDVPSAMADELTTRMQEVDNMRSQTQDLKGDAIAQAMPQIHEGITSQVKENINNLQSKINKMEKDPYNYPQRLVNKLKEDLNQYKAATGTVVERPKGLEEISPEVPEIAQQRVDFTPIRVDENPNKKIFPWLRDSDVPPSIKAGETQPIQAELRNATPQKAINFQPIEYSNKTPVEIFNAGQELKRTLGDYTKFDKMVTARDEGYDFIKKARDVYHDLKNGLEDTDVWGKAGEIQRDTNAAITKQIGAIKDFGKKFTGSIMGENVADPDKIRGFINSLEKGKGKIKSDVFSNYLKHTNELADTLNEIHTSAGLDAPIRLSPTAAINHTLENTSKGTALGNWLYDKGLGNIAGSAAAEATGAGLGTLVGHPMIGAYLGEKALAPVFSSIARPLMESATNSAGAKASIDYVASVIKGDKLLNQATQNIFKAGGEILPEKLLPNNESRERLETSLQYAQNPQNMMNIGGNLGHYLPNHSSAAAATAASAVNYLNNLKPKQIKLNPLDKPAPVDKAQMAKYHRALDVAQQPLIVIEHVKKGTLQPLDVQTLDAIYPAIHQKIVKKLSENMINAISEGHSIPYKQKVSLSLLMGQPLDMTNTQPAMQSVIASNAAGNNAPSQQQAPGKRKPNSQTVKASEKVADLYQTPSQARAAARLKI